MFLYKIKIKNILFFNWSNLNEIYSILKYKRMDKKIVKICDCMKKLRRSEHKT